MLQPVPNQQPEQILPQPSPSQFTVQVAKVGFQHYAVLVMQTTYGTFTFFIDPKAAEVMGRALGAAAVTAASGLVLPPSVQSE